MPVDHDASNRLRRHIIDIETTQSRTGPPWAVRGPAKPNVFRPQGGRVMCVRRDRQNLDDAGRAFAKNRCRARGLTVRIIDGRAKLAARIAAFPPTGGASRAGHGY